MKYPKQFKKYIRETATEIRTEFFLGEYNLDINYMEEDDEETACDVIIDDVYLHFTLRVYPCCLRDWKEGKIETVRKYIIHEFCHALIEPIIELVKQQQAGLLVTEKQRKDTCERQTCRIANIIDNLINQ